MNTSPHLRKRLADWCTVVLGFNRCENSSPPLHSTGVSIRHR
jgi:hypothetical protein